VARSRDRVRSESQESPTSADLTGVGGADGPATRFVRAVGVVDNGAMVINEYVIQPWFEARKGERRQAGKPDGPASPFWP
jgi:hypothetical protein